MENVTEPILRYGGAFEAEPYGIEKAETHENAGYAIFKRVFDLFASLLGLLILSPLFAVVALLIKVEDGGPIIHTRVCMGRNGPYKMYKFRSMHVDADTLEKWLTPEQITMYRKESKLDSDPRITKIGAFLRKTSIDELPQLLSVLKGDMSIVGPRPLVEAELSNFGNDLDELLLAPPGITGYWQVNGRSNSTFESGERQALELYYVSHRSLRLDIKILFQTVSVVLKGIGAK